MEVGFGKGSANIGELIVSIVKLKGRGNMDSGTEFSNKGRSGKGSKAGKGGVGKGVGGKDAGKGRGGKGVGGKAGRGKVDGGKKVRLQEYLDSMIELHKLQFVLLHQMGKEI